MKIKIIRKDSIGSISFDSNLNNDWSLSDLQKVLNSGVYWNKTKGECSSKTCDFQDTGLDLDAKKYISNVIYSNGSFTNGAYTPSNFYKNEHNNNINWTGKIGIMYASDYGYATSGGSPEKRNACLNKNLRSWSEEISLNCIENNWLFERGATQWLIDLRLNDGNMFINYDGCVSYVNSPKPQLSVKPVLYLKSDVKITGGTGEEGSPFILE